MGTLGLLCLVDRPDLWNKLLLCFGPQFSRRFCQIILFSKFTHDTMSVPVSYEINEIIDFVKKFADLMCVDFFHNDLQYWEVFSKKFRFSPNDNVEDGFYPVRCIFDSAGKTKLKILNFIAREANWFHDRTEAEVLIRSISYYGHRHKFCPGSYSFL